MKALLDACVLYPTVMREVLLGVAAVVTLLATGCSSAQGDCTYDTDCPGLCEICDTTQHTCVTDPTCEDIKDGKCSSDADCDPLHERCQNGTCVGGPAEVCGGTNTCNVAGCVPTIGCTLERLSGKP